MCDQHSVIGSRLPSVATPYQPRHPLPAWLPAHWESDSFPLYDSLPAFRAWLNVQATALASWESAERSRPVLQFANSGGQQVRDAYRLVEVLRKREHTGLPREPRGPISAHDAAIELAMLVDVLDGLIQQVVVQSQSPPKKSAKRKWTNEAADAEARKIAKRTPSFRKASSREWQKRIGCALGMISKLPFWQECQERKPNRKRGGTKAPRAVSLTTRLESTLGVGDSGVVLDENHLELLHRLVDEQYADREPSPLEPDSGRRRKPRAYKRA